MLRRKIYNELLEWKNHKSKECLLIKGARQIGKTYIVNFFGKHEYQSFIYLNFIEKPEFISLFDGDLSPEEIKKRISFAIKNVNFIKNKTLIFLDEIQMCPNARTALKFLAMDESIDVIASGSLLGIHYKSITSVPVGYEKQITMYSLDFEEFLWANGYNDKNISNLREYYETQTIVPEAPFW